MRTKNPYLRFLQYIFVASVILPLLALSHCSKTLTTEAEPLAGGIVLHDPDTGPSPRTPDDQKIKHGEPVRLEAVPNQGFVFSHWLQTGDESPVLEFDMTGDRTRTAVFIPDPAIARGDPPTVSISSHTDGAQIPTGTVSFVGSATDPKDGPLTGASLIWTSEKQGILGTGESISTVVGCGIDIITLTATNSEAGSGVASIRITAGTIPANPSTVWECNARPKVKIESPAPGDTFTTSGSISFIGSGFDIEDGPITGDLLVWRAGQAGQIGTGETFNASLTAGTHSITLNTVDSQGWDSKGAHVEIIVEQSPNTPPTANIGSPADGDAFHTADSIAFNGSGDDPDDGALTVGSLVWVSNLDGELGTGVSINASLTAGNHVITLDVTDSQGVTVSESVNITVVQSANAPPTANIGSPTDGDTFLTTDIIAFNGSGDDAEDTDLTGASLVWTSNLDGGLGTGESITASLTAGNHVIALDATDSQGGMVSEFVSITVNAPPNALPTAAIVSPANGDTFLTTDNIVFSGSANDPEDGPLIANSLVWSSTVGGQIGTGGSFGASLGVGNHTISLTATDSRQGVGAESVNITVEAPNGSPTARITSPVPGETFEAGVSIAFAGMGNDPEEGSLAGASLVWESDFDGEIGTGASFRASLSVGRHVITLKATDSQQAEGSQSVAVTVAALPPTATPVPQPMPLPEREGGAPHLFFGSATLNGYSAPEGTVVTAWVESFSEPVATAVVADGQYKFSVFQYGKRSFAGKTITFKIDDVEARETGIWESFGAELLNLTAGP